jgi:arylsulfatase A-like enzyme
MNFQVVSVGQKLIEKNVATGGYKDNIGTPTDALLDEFKFVDASIGAFVNALQSAGLSSSTLIVITAKHGQSPIDPSRFFPIPGSSGTNGASPANILCALLPPSSSPTCPATGVKAGIGPTQDDISLLWLTNSSQTASAVSMLENVSPPNNNIAGIGQIFSGPAIAQMFNPVSTDPRTPDIIVQPSVGVIYTGSTKKLAEHGGFAHDDTNVIMLVSNPNLVKKTVTTPVQTTQVAPTILSVLGLSPASLQAVQQEGTTSLPGIVFSTAVWPQ